MNLRILLPVLLCWCVSVVGGPSESGERVLFGAASFPDGSHWSLELAVTPQQWITGYMYRKEVPDGTGMLFVYQEPGMHTIWMKNCFVSLDILWLSDKGQVLHIVEQAPPCDDPGADCPEYGPLFLSTYVLELPAGSVAAHGIRVNDRIELFLPEAATVPSS